MLLSAWLAMCDASMAQQQCNVSKAQPISTWVCLIQEDKRVVKKRPSKRKVAVDDVEDAELMAVLTSKRKPSVGGEDDEAGPSKIASQDAADTSLREIRAQLNQAFAVDYDDDDEEPDVLDAEPVVQAPVRAANPIGTSTCSACYVVQAITRGHRTTPQPCPSL
jgi:hypothetical protein